MAIDIVEEGNVVFKSGDVHDLPLRILKIVEFKTGLARGFKIGEKNAGILRWVFSGSRAVGFIPTHWAFVILDRQLEKLSSEECDNLNWHSSPNIEPLYPNEPPVIIDQWVTVSSKPVGQIPYIGGAQ